MMQPVKFFIPFLLTFFTLSCVNTNTSVNEGLHDGAKPLQVKKSFLHGEGGILSKSDVASEDGSNQRDRKGGVQRLPSLSRDDVLFQSTRLSNNFSTKVMVKVAANNMSIQNFIHYVYGELLAVNYILTPEIAGINKPVTLSLQDQVSQRRLFLLAESILAERNLTLKYSDNVYLIAKVNPKSKSSTVVGVGRTASSVPAGSRRILQVVPILYGIKTTLKRTVEQLSDVTISIDAKQSALFVTGDYANVSRALELIRLLDSPANRGRHIGVVQLTYSSIGLYLDQISSLLTTEGVPNSINTPGNNNLVFVPLPQIGAVAIFAATKELYDRVRFWTKTLDKPSEGDVKQYFVFHPRYARARDIGESLTPLISARSRGSSAKLSTTAKKNRQDKSGTSSGQLSKSSRQVGGSNNDITFVVDERSNGIIFYTTGTEYRNVIPLIKRLDVLPKQVMLDIVIAEVKLTGNFKFGVEWALNNGVFSASTIGSFAVNKIGGLALLSTGGNSDKIQAAFLQDDQNINILSNPSLLVRDGVTASLDIGADVAIVGGTTQDPVNGTTINNQYRKTGIKVAITPTINAQGIVIMEINESISNTVPNSAGAGGNPNVFERNVLTEVVAENGQTVILAGLVDENKSTSELKVPFFGDLPLIGHLFKQNAVISAKTELVLMITPRVINRSDQWGDIMSSIKQNFENIQID